MGKILGGGLGFMFGGPLGAVLGAVIGHQFDEQKGPAVGLSVLDKKKSVYFVATFSMLAKLAKADGRVSEAEIAQIEQVMATHLRLDAQARSFAIRVFNEAKDSPASFEEFARQFHEEFRGSPEMLISAVEFLLVVALADGRLNRVEEDLIRAAVKIFGLENQYAGIKGRFIHAPDDLEHSYRVLGCAPGDSAQAVKRKYRQLAMRYHPDRMKAEGMPDELAEAALDKFKEIQHAYDTVAEHLGGTARR